MLVKVILKNYKSHLKNYIAFFACSVCTVAMLFAFWGIQDTFGENPGMNDSVYYQYDMLGDYMTAGVLVTVMAVLMMLFSQKNYIKFRLRNYQLLLVLGLRKKKFLQVFGLFVLTTVLAKSVVSFWLIELFTIILFIPYCFFVPLGTEKNEIPVSKIAKMQKESIIIAILLFMVFIILPLENTYKRYGVLSILWCEVLVLIGALWQGVKKCKE